MTELRKPRVKRIPINSAGVAAPKHTSYEEFLEWLDEDTLAEWLEGKVKMTSPGSNKHQDTVGFLELVLRPFVKDNNLGVIKAGPFQMKLARSGREPDLLFVANSHLSRLQDTFLAGPADLVVEVVSKESVSRDTKTKYREYAQAAIPEYWLFDPRKKEATFYQLDAHQQYQPIPLDAEGKYYSRALPGFWLNTYLLWQNPLSDLRKVLHKVGGDAYARLVIEKLRRQGFLP